ncbi:hypothetical protein GEMRC1_008195 [Eukaryota sp. GEM-RC1]
MGVWTYGRMAEWLTMAIKPYLAESFRHLFASQCLSNIYSIEPPLDNVQISTTDAFQGKEVDFVFVSTVRSYQEGNITQSLGFLTDERRMNVMLTRSRFSNFIYGHEKLLRTNLLWESLVDYYSASTNDYESELDQIQRRRQTAHDSQVSDEIVDVNAEGLGKCSPNLGKM